MAASASGSQKWGIVLKSGGPVGAAFEVFVLEWIERNLGLSVLNPNIELFLQSGGSTVGVPMTQGVHVETPNGKERVCLDASQFADVLRREHRLWQELGQLFHEPTNLRRHFRFASMAVRDIPARAAGAGLEALSNFIEPLAILRANPLAGRIMTGGLLRPVFWEDQLRKLPKRWNRDNVFTLASDWQNNVRVVMGSPDAEFPLVPGTVYESTDPATAVRASTSIPGLVEHPIVNGRQLRDGTNHSDLDLPVLRGCTDIIIIDPMARQSGQRSRPRPQDGRYEQLMRDCEEAEAQGANVYALWPDAPGLGYFWELMKPTHMMGIEQCAMMSINRLRETTERLADACGVRSCEAPKFGRLFELANAQERSRQLREELEARDVVIPAVDPTIGLELVV